jgi:PBSX family phage terminase large subunit
MDQVDFYIPKKIVQAWNEDKRYTVAYSGRGAGKTFGFAALCIIYALQNPGSRILAIRGTQNKISESSLQVLKDVIWMMRLDNFFEMTEHTLRCKNGSEFLFYGGSRNYHTFKSLQNISLCFVDEATEIPEEAWDVLIPTIRSDKSKFFISFNPELEEDWVYKQFVLNNRDDAVVVRLTYEDNDYFPDVLKKEMEWDKSRNYEKYLHIWEGHLIQQAEGALWKRNMIKHTPAPDRNFDEVVVAVDPSTTDKATSDACGIIVAAKKGDEYYILDDGSEILSPLDWAKRAISLYEKWQANRIVYEGNQGGMMVKTIIHQINPAIRCISYHARKNKMARAEEILSLYEQDKVHHVRNFTELEYEMVTYTGDKKQKSPNRLDALVYALKNLSKIGHAPRGTVRGNMKTMTGVMRPKVANPNRF